MEQEKQLVCKECGQPRKLGRKLCTKCNSKRVVNCNLKSRGTTKYEYVNKCEACSNMYTAHRRTQRFCSACWKARSELAAESISTNKYVYVNQANREKGENAWAHRRLAESVLQRKLTCHEVVHHIDDNPKNNDLTNLMVLDRAAHIRLHKFLDDQRVILEKSGNENLGNCWNNLITPMTTAWLETTSAKVKKLWELSQPAAEPLKGKSYEEGSETSAPSTLTCNDEGEDTVQTTTSNEGSGD